MYVCMHDKCVIYSFRRSGDTLYWTNIAAGSACIQRAFVNGTQVETVVGNVRTLIRISSSYLLPLPSLLLLPPLLLPLPPPLRSQHHHLCYHYHNYNYHYHHYHRNYYHYHYHYPNLNCYPLAVYDRWSRVWRYL